MSRHVLERRVRALWLAYILLLLFHTSLGFMPLFAKPSVSGWLTGMTDAQLQLVFNGMLLYFAIPVFIYVILSWNPEPIVSKWWQNTHLVVSCLYTILNFAHFAADLENARDRKDQILITLMLLVVGLIINATTFDLLFIAEYYTEIGLSSSPIEM